MIGVPNYHFKHLALSWTGHFKSPSFLTLTCLGELSPQFSLLPSLNIVTNRLVVPVFPVNCLMLLRAQNHFDNSENTNHFAAFKGKYVQLVFVFHSEKKVSGCERPLSTTITA